MIKSSTPEEIVFLALLYNEALGIKYYDTILSSCG